MRKRYGDLWALDGATFEIAYGECFALLGPNGAGKTTVTEILEGYRTATRARPRCSGTTRPTATAHWRSQLGIVLQSDRDLGDLTVPEAVHHFAGYYPDPRDPDDVIAAVGLTEKRRSRNEKLSGGQRRRLDVALGIIGRPRVLFLDEPTTGFDPEARRDFWTLIEGLKAEGTTILLTTHYLEEAEHLADRVAVISRGASSPATPRPGSAVASAAAPASAGSRTASASRARRWTRPRPSSSSPRRFDGEIPGLEVHRETLEDVYLAAPPGRPRRRGGRQRMTHRHAAPRSPCPACRRSDGVGWPSSSSSSSATATRPSSTSPSRWCCS